ncbi:MAG: extracellular solute-binding protein [Oscillospiraceae bacterium]|nr:extracellular solute-binding protein [Oscillospiraceae bacterium]
MIKRRIAIGLIAALLALALISCGGGAQTSQTTAGAAQQTTAAQQQATAAQAAATEAAAADNFNPEGLPIVNEPITLSVVVRDDSSYEKPYDELELNKQWAADTNVNVEWVMFDGSSWNDKINLMLVSGDLPDVIFGPVSNFNELTYAAQGYWQPLQDLIEEHTVWLKEYSQMYPELYTGYITPDGNIYSLPRMKGQEDMEYINRSFINQEWLDNLGLSMPNNVDELYDVLISFRDDDPNGNGKDDEIPLTFIYKLTTTDRQTGGDNRNSLFGLFGLHGRVDAIDHIVIENGEPVFTADKEEYMNAVAWFRKLYDEGMIDPEAFTMDTAAYKAKNTTGELVYGVWNGWTVEEATNPPEDGIVQYTMMPPLENVNGVRMWPQFSYNVVQKGYFLITRENKYPRETIRWIDYFSDPYVSIQHDWGIEGLGSKINDDGSWEILGGGLRSTRTAEGMSWLAPTMVPKHIYDKCIYTSPVKKYEADACHVYSPYGIELFPNVYFTLEELQDMIQLSSDLGSYIGKMTAQWIVDGGIESGWDEYIKTLNNIGLEKYMKIYKDNYERYQSSLG